MGLRQVVMASAAALPLPTCYWRSRSLGLVPWRLPPALSLPAPLPPVPLPLKQWWHPSYRLY